MKSTLKKIAVITLALAMVFAFAACGKKSLTVQKGKLIMVTNAAFPPYEFIGDDGETIVGIDAEIAKMVADELKLELQIEDMEFSSLISAVQSGKADIALAGMTVTEDRLKNVNFTSTYAQGVQVVIVKSGSPITSIDDLDGAKIGVQESTTGHIYCEDDYGTDNVEAYATGALAVEALLKDKVDCVVIDNEPAKAFVAANSGLEILDTEYVVEDYAAAVNKQNTELLDSINKVLDAKIADGTVAKIVAKYINAD